MTTNYILNKLLLTKDLKTIKEVLVSIRGNFEKQAEEWRDDWRVIVLVYYILMFKTYKKKGLNCKKAIKRR